MIQAVQAVLRLVHHAVTDKQRSIQADETDAIPKDAPQQGSTAAEWITLGLSLTILVALVGLVLYQHVTSSTEPPVIEVQPQLAQIRKSGSFYYVPVEVQNRGGLTAQDVQVQMSLAHGAEARETVQFSIPFLAGSASEIVVIIFQHDPAQGEIKIESISFTNP